MVPLRHDGCFHAAVSVQRPALGFAARLGLATSVLIVVVCVAQSWLLARRDLDNVRHYLTDRGRTLSQSLARQAASSLATGNVAELHRLAEEVRAQSGVTYSRFFDVHGLLLVSVGSPPPTAAPPGAKPTTPADAPIDVGAGSWEFQATSRTAGGSAAGTVAVGISLEPLEGLRRRTFATAAAFTSLFTLAAVLGAAFLARAITRPLQALATAADTIARGDFGTRVEVRTHDEVGRLARSFNAMAESLARSRTTLEEKLEELEKANRLKSEFLNTISHELRTPLNVILGYTEMLAEGGAGAVSPEQAELLAGIQRYSKLQLELVSNVLDFSRLSTGTVSLEVERFALAPLLSEILALYDRPLREAGLGLTVYLDPDLPELETDRTKVQEIVRNLVDNAVKFTERGGVSLLACRGSGTGRVTVEVTDTGAGIAPEDVPHIFDAFHQVGESSTRRTSGLGLGLSLARQLAEALGGTVTVTSRVGQGSTFRLDIPCRLPGRRGDDAPLPAADAVLDEVMRNTSALPEQARTVRAALAHGSEPSGRGRTG